jgi:TPR repeat protein
MAYPQKLEHDADASVKEAVRVLHQGLSVLAGQITATGNNSAHVAALLTSNWEQMARRLSEMRAEVNDCRRVLDDRLSASEKTAHYNNSALEHALDKIEAVAIQRAVDQEEFQRYAARHEQLLERLSDTCQRLEKRLPDSNLVHRLEAVEQAIAGLTGQTMPDQSSSSLLPAPEALSHRLTLLEDDHASLLSELRGGAVDAVPQADEGPSLIEPPAPEAGDNDLAAARDSEDLFARPESGPVNFLSSARMSASSAPDAARPRFLILAAAGLVAVLTLAGVFLLQHQARSEPAIKPASVLHSYSLPPPPKVPVKPGPQDSGPGPQFANRHAPSSDRVQALAAQGNPLALTVLGLQSVDGTGGVAVNLPDAVKYLTRAAEKGQAVAQYRLGSMYERGQGVAIDPVKAAHWYDLSAVQGNREAMHNLAVYYAARKDMAESARWFAKAAGLGLADSQFNLAILYERGDGVPQSLADAFKWYSIAAASGDAESKTRMVLLRNQLSDADKAAATKAAQAFRPYSIDRAANVPPEAGELPSG